MKLWKPFFFLQLISCVWLFVTPWTAACQTPVSSTTSWSLLKFMSIELVMLSNHLIVDCPVLLLPSIFPSIRVFSNESAPASASVLPMNIHCWFPLELTGLISLLSRVLSKVFFNSRIGKHQFFSAQPPLWSNSYIHSWVKENKKKPQ